MNVGETTHGTTMSNTTTSSSILYIQYSIQTLISNPYNSSITMSTNQYHRKKLDLEIQVNELQAVLDREQRLNRFLRFAIHEPLVVSHSSCHSCLSSVIPAQVLKLTPKNVQRFLRCFPLKFVHSCRCSLLN